MKRYAANILYCSSDRILRNGVVEINEKNGLVKAVFSLEEVGDEVQSTIFFNGILLPFKPILTTDLYNQNIYSLLKDILIKEGSDKISCGEEVKLWLLKGEKLLTTQIVDDSCNIIPIY